MRSCFVEHGLERVKSCDFRNVSVEYVFGNCVKIFVRIYTEAASFEQIIDR